MAARTAESDEFNPYEAPEPAQVRRPDGDIGPHLPRGDEPDEVELLRYDLNQINGWMLVRGTIRGSWPLSKNPYLTSAFVPLFLACLGYFVGSTATQGQAGLICAFTALLWPLIKVLGILLALVQYRKVVRSFGVQTVCAAPSYLAIRNSQRELKVTWHTVTKVVVDRWDIILQGKPAQLLYIPRSVFASTDDAVRFVQQIRSHMAPRD